MSHLSDSTTEGTRRGQAHFSQLRPFSAIFSLSCLPSATPSPTTTRKRTRPSVKPKKRTTAIATPPPPGGAGETRPCGGGGSLLPPPFSSPYLLVSERVMTDGSRSGARSDDEINQKCVRKIQIP